MKANNKCRVCGKLEFVMNADPSKDFDDLYCSFECEVQDGVDEADAVFDDLQVKQQNEDRDKASIGY